MVVLHEEGGSGAHAKFTGLLCFTLLRRNSGDNSFHQKINNEYSMLVLYIGKEYFPFAEMWDVDHPGPPAMHKIILVYPGRIAGPIFPTISCSDEGTIMTSLNSASLRKLTVPAILLPHVKTGRHCTTSYHCNPLGQTSLPRSSILERREYVSALQ